jgi:5-methylcytosine-specific restriction enzyme subunit McrC
MIFEQEKNQAITMKMENREEVQHFLQFLHKSSLMKSNKYVGVFHFEDQTINLLPKIFHDTVKERKNTL